MKALTGGRLFDGNGGDVLENAVVIVENDRILEVGPASSVSFPADTEVFDLKGLTLLPGLIDAHDHLGHNDYDLMDRWELDAPNSFRNIRTAKVLEEVLGSLGISGDLFAQTCIIVDKMDKLSPEVINEQLTDLGHNSEVISTIQSTLGLKHLNSL